MHLTLSCSRGISKATSLRWVTLDKSLC